MYFDAEFSQKVASDIVRGNSRVMKAIEYNRQGWKPVDTLTLTGWVVIPIFLVYVAGVCYMGAVEGRSIIMPDAHVNAGLWLSLLFFAILSLMARFDPNTYTLHGDPVKMVDEVDACAVNCLGLAPGQIFKMTKDEYLKAGNARLVEIAKEIVRLQGIVSKKIYPDDYRLARQILRLPLDLRPEALAAKSLAREVLDRYSTGAPILGQSELKAERTRLNKAFDELNKHGLTSLSYAEVFKQAEKT